MCSDCEEEFEPFCSYCGEACFGMCDDPDICPTCWIPANDPFDFDDLGFSDDAAEGCLRDECICQCHLEMFDDLGMRVEAGVLKHEDKHGLPYLREGVFPFLKLPGEIREKVYDYAFLQDGEQRKCANHRGTIHTALLGTCRQINNEARNLPLTRNRLCFNSPIYALDFLGFQLAPSQRDLVTGLHIEFYIGESSNSSWTLLLRELSKMSITHLGQTVKGKFPLGAVSEHVCFTNRLKVLKDLKTFDLILTPGSIAKSEKESTQETMRENLIKDYVRPKKRGKSRTKRTANFDSNEVSTKPAKKAKTASSKIKNQTQTIVAPKSTRLGSRSQKPERDAAKAAKERARQALLDQYNQLKQYATSLYPDTAPVKIRLEQAREAVEAIDEAKFEALAHGIFLTLEEGYDKIVAARKDIPSFSPPHYSEPESSSELSHSFDDQDLSET